MWTGRRGRVLEIAGLLRAGIHDRLRLLTTAIDRPLRRQMVAAATRMAGTRTGTVLISPRHVLVGRREVITRMLPRITPVVVAAAALMRHHRVLIRHRVVVILRRRVPTPLLAVVTAAEVGVAEAAAADRTGAVAAPRTEEEVTPEAAGDRTATKTSSIA